MSTNLELHPSLNLLTHRFNQVKRINNSNEVASFYNSCVQRLSDSSRWDYMSLFDFPYRVTTHDKFGFPIYGKPETGDYLKITSTATFQVNSILWLRLENVSLKKELSYSEEVLSMTLRETENIGALNELLHTQQLKSKCVVNLRRILNTVSVDIKVDDQNVTKKQKSLVDYFKWETFAKQILLQL